MRLQIRMLDESELCQNINSIVNVSLKINLASNQSTFLNLLIPVIPKPPRENRLLFSNYHSLKYPEDGYILRDSIFGDTKYPYDWKGDSLMTNYVQLFNYLSSKGYIIETLSEALTCFNSSHYSSILIIDPEKLFSRHEILKL